MVSSTSWCPPSARGRLAGRCDPFPGSAHLSREPKALRARSCSRGLVRSRGKRASSRPARRLLRRTTRGRVGWRSRRYCSRAKALTMAARPGGSLLSPQGDHVRSECFKENVRRGAGSRAKPAQKNLEPSERRQAGTSTKRRRGRPSCVSSVLPARSCQVVTVRPPLTKIRHHYEPASAAARARSVSSISDERKPLH
jgi:hypothetical protein